VRILYEKKQKEYTTKQTTKSNHTTTKKNIKNNQGKGLKENSKRERKIKEIAMDL